MAESNLEKAARRMQPLAQAIQQASQAFMTMKQLGRALKDILPECSAVGESPNARIRQAEFLRISELLVYCGKPAWSFRPRIFAIAWMMDCPEMMEEIVENNLSDHSLPFKERNLPYYLKDKESQKRFLEVQDMVLDPEARDLEEWGSGKHINFPRNADDYFRSVATLGSGSHGHVDKVYSQLGNRIYARKRIQRGHTFKQDGQKLRNFQNELRVLQKLHHPHLIKFVGSYTDPDWVGLIMWPVAKSNLQTYLEIANPDTSAAELRSFFGCLAEAVTYLHKENIRHKDIKPANILVDQGKIWITDFGISKDWSDDTGSTTDTPFRYILKTPWYASPEVMDASVSITHDYL